MSYYRNQEYQIIFREIFIKKSHDSAQLMLITRLLSDIAQPKQRINQFNSVQQSRQETLLSLLS